MIFEEIHEAASHLVQKVSADDARLALGVPGSFVSVEREVALRRYAAAHRWIVALSGGCAVFAALLLFLIVSRPERVVLPSDSITFVPVPGYLQEVSLTVDADGSLHIPSGEVTVSKVVEETIPAGWTSVQAPRGILAHVSLPDGSSVALNSNSILSFPKEFPEDSRNVTLSGEAFFEVSKDADRPFTVNTENIAVHVYGTSFGVCTGDEAEVYLLEGSVAVESGSLSAELRPGEKAVLSGGSLSVSQAKVEESVYWKDRVLRLDNSTITEVVNKIEQHYGVSIQIAGTAMGSGKVINGKLVLRDSVEAVLDNVCSTFGLEWDKTAGNYYIIID